MADGTLYTYPESFRAYKPQIAARFSGYPLKVVSQPPDFELGVTNKTDGFLKKFPFGKVPAFESSNGLYLNESNAIAYYVANEAMRGKTAAEAAQVLQWVNFADNEILPAASTWVFPCLGALQYNKQNTDKAKDEIKAALAVLNEHLLTRTFLVGERITLADISVASNLVLLYRLVLDADFRKPFQNVNRWFLTIANQEHVKGVIGELKLCEQMAQFDAKKFAELSGGGAKEAAKEKKPKEPKEERKQKKAGEAKAEAPKKPAPKHEEPEEEAEEITEKPVKDPFALMPKGTFVMDAWKKTYSNNDTVTVALPYLWANFDPEHYSVWYCEYKYPEELKAVFMSCNAITGFYQRLDRLRKYAFASMILFGEDNNSTISGVFIWLGHELAFTLDDDIGEGYDVFNWTKLDYSNPDVKTKIAEYFSWVGNFDGKHFNQGKIFK